MSDTAEKRRSSRGVTLEPTMNAAVQGSVQRPASSGDSPSTSCRYWARKT